MAQHDDCIVYLLAKAYQKAYGHLKKRLQPIGLTPVQALVLAAVAENEGLAAGDIGKTLTLDAATLSGVLDRLADNGFVEKQKDPDDKRITRLHLSAKAGNIMDILVDERNRANEHVLAGLSVEEKVLLKRLLRDVRD